MTKEDVNAAIMSNISECNTKLVISRKEGESSVKAGLVLDTVQMANILAVECGTTSDMLDGFSQKKDGSLSFTIEGDMNITTCDPAED